MSLLSLWNESQEQLLDKKVSQIIAFAGSGKLLDGNDAANEFREFLNHIPSALLANYLAECIDDSFPDSGLALQDLVNQVGRRLDFEVIDGLYRGKPGIPGQDGIWKMPSGETIVVEVKTTAAYQIKLDSIWNYRKTLIKDSSLSEENSSILIVVGRQDTKDLEAQVRGSKYAWDMRLISVDSLLRLLKLKEEVDDPQIIKKIRDILLPQEFTKLDGIIDIVFSAAEDVKDVLIEDEEGEEGENERKPKFVPASFHDACVERIKAHLSKNLIKKSRGNYASPEGDLRLTCQVSKEHQKYSSGPAYWFAFHQHYVGWLADAKKSYVAFGCGSEDNLLLIPFQEFENFLDGLNTTEKENRSYWHVQVHNEDGKYILRRKKGFDHIDVSEYLLESKAS